MIDAVWQVQDAKQRFSEVLRRARTEGVQIVTKHGVDVAVVMDIDDYRRLAGQGTDFKSFLRDGPRSDQPDIPRSRDLPRELDLTRLR